MFIALCELFLIVAHALVTWAPKGTYHDLTVRMVHLDGEGNLPAYFSSTQLLFLALVLFVIFQLRHQDDSRPRSAWPWLFCAVMATVMSVDEAASVHEYLGTMLGRVIDPAEPGSFLYVWRRFPGYYWMLIYLPPTFLLFPILARFFWREMGQERWYVLQGVIVFLVGAVLIEFLEGSYGSVHRQPFEAWILGHPYWIDPFLFEESFEMVGITMILFGCITLLQRLVTGKPQE